MIFSNREQLREYGYLEDRIKACMDYIDSHPLEEMEPGKYEINGSHLYMNLESFTTLSAEGRDFEAHKRYLDMFYIVEGEEKVEVCPIEMMCEKEYIEERDRISLTGNPQNSMILRAGDFLVCYPDDAHRPAIFVDKPQKIKKAVFKIEI